MASQVGRAGVFLPARCRNDSSPRHSSGVTAGRRRETRARAASSTASCEWECPRSIVQALKASSAGLAVAGLVMATPLRACAEDLTQLSSTQPIADTSQIIASVPRAELNERMKEFEQRTGYRLRVYTTQPGGINSNQARANWAPLGNNTLMVRFDATAPTIMAFDYIGDDYLSALRRPFMVELQSRYGNMFYVRDNGESASVVNVANTLMMCLEKEGGCRVVPGLPMDQYWFTLVLSIAGGLVFGFASRLPPAGFVQRSWIWLLLFSPLWGTLFVSFGLGPVVSRTQEWWPVAANTAAFLAIAAAFRPSPIFPQERTDADM